MSLETVSVCNKLKKLNNEQLKLYTNILRKELLNLGVEEASLTKAIKQSIQILKNESSFEKRCQTFLQDLSCDSKERRGVDSIGRILVEYCFFRSPKVRMLWPEASSQNIEATKKFVEGVIPRPLMNYFLVSVRGTIPALNKFEAGSVLFGEENATQEERKEYVNQLVSGFTNADLSPKEKWEQIYSDKRFQKCALDLIGDIRRKIVQFGLERYLRILENLRQRDPDNKRENGLVRPITIDDIKQLDDALWNAEEYLSKLLNEH